MHSLEPDLALPHLLEPVGLLPGVASVSGRVAGALPSPPALLEPEAGELLSARACKGAAAAGS